MKTLWCAFLDASITLSRWNRVRGQVWPEPNGAAETPAILVAIDSRALHPWVKLLASPGLSFSFDKRLKLLLLNAAALVSVSLGCVPAKPGSRKAGGALAVLSPGFRVEG